MKVWIVDDEESIRKIIQLRLSREGFETFVAESADQFVERMGEAKGQRGFGEIPLVITDLKMPGHDGFWLMDWLKEKSAETKTIVITGHGEKEVAVSALKHGAADYLEKPFDLDELVHSVRRCEREIGFEIERKEFTARLEARVQRLEKPAVSDAWFASRSAAMKDINQWLQVLAREAAASPQAEEPAVLILGENGTGKEGIARQVHAGSARAAGAWVAVNCANFSDQLLESELFGHEKGSFTGATQQKRGLFELAHKGSLFLDEIGEMPVALQAKLLRVLQEKTLRRVGGVADIKVDVRVISATNARIETSVAQGKFREDLFHRLNRVILRLPALRERSDELVEMAKFFFKRAFDTRGKKFSGFSTEASQRILAYAWPGNVRELANVAERAALLLETGREIDATLLPGGAVSVGGSGSKKRALPAVGGFTEARKQMLTEFESDFVRQALESHSGDVSAAAKSVGMDRSNFARLAKKHGLG